MYAYNVRIENELHDRTGAVDCDGLKSTRTEGKNSSWHGVIGKQPVLGVGEKFEYTSAVPLKHLKGQMTGGYLMASQQTGKVFEAKLESFETARTEEGERKKRTLRLRK